MRHRVVALGLGGALLLGACSGEVSDEHVIDEPMSLFEVQNGDGIDVDAVRLTSDAERRLGIETVEITVDGGRLVIPLAAVLVDTTGTRWVYTRREPLVYVRRSIEVADEVGLTVLATAGPEPGTEIAVVGVPELWGAETGMDH
jgi:hypothetical protein